MVNPASSQQPAPFLGIFPELNTQCLEINRHCDCRHKFGFIFWASVLMLSTTMFTKEIYHMTRRYFEFNISLTYRIMGATSLEYPDFILCPMNTLNITKMRNEGLDNMTIALILSAFDRSSLDREYFGRSLPAYQKWLAEKNNSKMQNLEQTLLYFALHPRQQLAYCENGGVKGPCVPDNREIHQFVSREGVCFVIEPRTMLDNGSVVTPQQTSPGDTGGFAISLHKSKDEEFEISGKRLLDNYLLRFTKDRFVNSGDRGLVSDVIGLAPASATQVPITEKRIRHLDQPYSECINEQKMMEYTCSNYSMVNNTAYNSLLCHRECEAMHAMKQCNTSCILPGYLGNTKHGLPVCGFGESFDCVRKQTKTSNCRHCKNFCEYTTWQFHYSNVRINTDKTYVYIYHPEMTYILSIETPSDPLSSLLGAVGGQLSLWLGFKIATVIQIAYYACYWIGSRCMGHDIQVAHDKIRVGPRESNVVING